MSKGGPTLLSHLCYLDGCARDWAVQVLDRSENADVDKVTKATTQAVPARGEMKVAAF